MKKRISPLHTLIMAALAATPAVALGLPAAGSAYNTDTTNSYVQDQTSQVMGQLNGILCYMGGMAPSQMVGVGNYIALVDKNTCEAKGSGGQSNNTGASYTSVVVNSTRASTNDPMLVKAWVEPQPNMNIKVYASASQAPSASLPYGVFRMDYCGGTSCSFDKGFINATTNGLQFFSAFSDGTNSDSTQLLLNATSSTAGSGAISQAYNFSGFSGSSNFLFKYNTSYFVRNDSPSTAYDANKDICFDRTAANADESVWRYGLYDSNGDRVTRNSGFPIEYTSAGTTYMGYMGYYGLWLPVTPTNGDTVTKITYSSNAAPTKTNYTLMKTSGKLMKFTTAIKTLADLNKITFWYYAQNNVGTAMTAGSQYELYWNNTDGQFYVSGKQNSTSFNMEPYTTPVAVVNTDLVAANSWGLFGWSQMMGGQFGIKGDQLALLNSGTLATRQGISVTTQIQDVVYPSQFAAIGNLKCINDCPTAALISTSNAGTGTAYSNAGWTPVASTSFVNYTLNATSGNLVDAASADVASTATSGTNANGVRSGRLVTTADATTMAANKDASGVCGGTTPGTCTTFNQGDIDFLPVGSSYYVWETGGQPWNSLALLKDGTGAPVTFDAPLQVSFAVPTGAKYGSYQGATIALQYGGFGDLWGIPNECVDITTNTACVFSGGSATAQNNQRWTSKFSIPFDTTNGVVTANSGATTYYVKPLDMEIRLANVSCTTAGLSTASLSFTGLPTASDFVDPSSNVGSKPTVTDAPRVIHGVKQY